MINILTKERIDTELRNNGRFEARGRTVWNICEIPIAEDERALAVLDMYEYQDTGILEVKGTKNPKCYVGGVGAMGTDMDGYAINLFSNCIYLRKKC